MELANNCSPQLIPVPVIFGAKITSFEASLVQNFSVNVPKGVYPNHGAINAQDLVFCNVTVTHIRPGLNQNTTTQVWLPTEIWNRRMQGIGGAKWFGELSSTSSIAMAGAVAEGYIALTTDGGHPPTTNPEESPLDWMLMSPGNIDMAAVRTYASVSLNDAAAIGKSLSEGLYGRRPAYSYWSGCSEGGRQGLALAEKYPNAFDGIVASAPLLPQYAVAGYWPQYLMNQWKAWPLPCELKAITTKAIRACDNNDGVEDGLMSRPESCKFNAFKLVNAFINCPDTPTGFTRISQNAAALATAIWSGAGALSEDDSFFWYGFNYETPLTGEFGLANTECDSEGRCRAKPPPFFLDWIRLFVQKDPKFDATRMTPGELRTAFHASIKEYADVLGGTNPDLNGFRDRGGKLLMYHGLVSHFLSDHISVLTI
jgi:Tannase and feruloyl esterase